MLAALVVYLMMSGGGASGPMLYMDAAAENIETHVLDEARRDEALEVVDAMLDRSKDHLKTLDGMREQLGDLLSNHAVTAEELDGLWNNYFELDAQYSSDIIDKRFELKNSLTREEWSATFSSASEGANKP